MKQVKFRFLMTSAIVLMPLLLSTVVDAEDGAKSMTSKGEVTVQDSGKTGIVDPEIPKEIIEPVGPSTNGSLRIDYVTPVDFGKVKIGKTKRTFNALANNIVKTKKVRGGFIQVTDFREKRTGWSLQVKQETQFKTSDYDELTGAVLSLDKGWANSTSTSEPPTVTRDTLAINNIGQSYDVARASNNAGGGVWSIIFGASKDNDDNQPVTIMDDKESTSKDKAIFRNSAIKLTIPDSTKVVPKEYQTKITWILSETP